MMMNGWYGPGGGYNMMQGNFWWMGLAMMLIQLLFWAGIIYIVFRLVKSYISRQAAPNMPEDRALSLLRERYAKGEIELEEYNIRKRELER